MLDNKIVVAVNKSIDLGYIGALTGGVGDDPVGMAGVGGIALLPESLDFLKRRVVLPNYHSSYLRIKWYNTDDTNFELDNYSIHTELLSKEHDDISIYN